MQLTGSTQPTEKMDLKLRDCSIFHNCFSFPCKEIYALPHVIWFVVHSYWYLILDNKT